MAETLTRNGTTPLRTEATVTLRTSVGEFVLRQNEFGWCLEVRAGKIRRVLGNYETDNAAILALRNRHTSFPPWDMMGRNAVAIQIDTPERWVRHGDRR